MIGERGRWTRRAFWCRLGARPKLRVMSHSATSFVHGLFAGEIHDDLLFPYPEPLSTRDPDEARTVRRLLDSFEQMRATGLIDSARFDEEETIPEEVIQTLAANGFLGLSIPREYGGLGLSSAAYAHVFGTLSSADASIGVLLGVHCGLGSKAIVMSRRPVTFRCSPRAKRLRPMR